MNKIYISWSEVGEMIDELVDDIRLHYFDFDGIYGVPRGGLPIAVVLSHRLRLPLLLHPTERTLIVDDISDTGKTLMSHKNKVIATLYTTKWTKTKPRFWISKKTKKTDWIIFPWEDQENEGE